MYLKNEIKKSYIDKNGSSKFSKWQFLEIVFPITTLYYLWIQIGWLILKEKSLTLALP